MLLRNQLQDMNDTAMRLRNELRESAAECDGLRSRLAAAIANERAAHEEAASLRGQLQAEFAQRQALDSRLQELQP